MTFSRVRGRGNLVFGTPAFRDGTSSGRGWDEINGLLQAGADAFVTKPFNIEKLIERIGELLTV